MGRSDPSFGESVVVTRLGLPTTIRDSQGRPILAASTTITIDNVAVAGSESAESDFGQKIITGYNLFLPSGTVLLPTDRLTVRGVPGWQVEGLPTQWTSPYDGEGKGVEATVRKAS